MLGVLNKAGVKLEYIYIEEMNKSRERNSWRNDTTYNKVDANSKYMNNEYEKSQPSSHPNYLDAHHLYVLAVCQTQMIFETISMRRKQ